MPGSTARIYKQLLSLLKLKIPHNDKFTEGLKFKYTSDLWLPSSGRSYCNILFEHATVYW